MQGRKADLPTLQWYDRRLAAKILTLIFAQLHAILLSARQGILVEKKDSFYEVVIHQNSLFR